MAKLINTTAMTVDGVIDVGDWFVAVGDHDDAARAPCSRPTMRRCWWGARASRACRLLAVGERPARKTTPATQYREPMRSPPVRHWSRRPSCPLGQPRTVLTRDLRELCRFFARA
jgi:hypothetical protein